MIASPLRFLTFFALVILVNSTEVKDTPIQVNHEMGEKKIELYDGVYLKIPEANNTEKLLSFEVETYRRLGEGRGKKKKLLERFLPLFLMPFIIQSTIVPFFLGFLKFMLFKSLMVGKLALALILLNAFKNHNSFKGRESEIANVHYGYHGNGMEEYGAYVN